MSLKKAIVLTLALASAGWVKADDKKPWKNVTEGSYVSSNGNSKATTAAGKNTFNYDWTKTSLELIGGGYGAKSSGVQTAEQYFASEKVSYKLTDERNYIFEKYRWDKDRFAGIHNRHDSTAGVGRELFKTLKDLFIGELSGGYVSEERVNQPSNGFASGRVYGKYTRTISETASFNQDAEYTHNFENGDDFRVKTETSLLAALSTHLSLKVGYIWKHVGVPPVGFGRNDTITTVGLVATY